MYCPKCSTEASTEQKFCRACGMELQAVAELVQSDNSSQKPDRKDESGLQMRNRALFIWGCVAMFGAGAVGAALKVLGKEGIRPAGEFTPYVLALAVMAALFGMGLICLASLGASPRRGLKKQSGGLDQTVNSAVRQLPGQPSSITEKTTEFLEGSEASMRVRDTAPNDN